MKKQLAIAAGVLLTLGTAFSDTVRNEAPAATPTRPLSSHQRTSARAPLHKWCRCGRITQSRAPRRISRVHFDLNIAAGRAISPLNSALASTSTLNELPPCSTLLGRTSSPMSMCEAPSKKRAGDAPAPRTSLSLLFP